MKTKVDGCSDNCKVDKSFERSVSPVARELEAMYVGVFLCSVNAVLVSP